MLDGPELTEREVFDRIVSVFQTYDPHADARYRTAIVLEQRPPRLQLNGEHPPYLLWLIEADSRQGTSSEIHACESLASAEAAATRWLGSDRRVDFEQMSSSALVVVMSQIQRLAWR